MQKIFGRHLDMGPMFLILGLPNRNITTAAGRRLYNILIFAARKVILLQWTSDKAPGIQSWSKVVYELLP